MLGGRQTGRIHPTHCYQTPYGSDPAHPSFPKDPALARKFGKLYRIVQFLQSLAPADPIYPNRAKTGSPGLALPLRPTRLFHAKREGKTHQPTCL